MKKYCLYILGILTIIMLPLNVHATGTASLSVECGDTTVGGNTTCTVYATPTNGLAAAKGNISVSGSSATITNITRNYDAGDIVNNSTFDLYGTLRNGKIALFTISLAGQSAGMTTVNVTLNFITDGDFDDDNIYVTGSGRVNVSAPQTQPAPTTRPTQQGRQTAAATTAPVVVEQPRPNVLYLTSLTVDEFEVREEEGIYYVTTDTNREYVDINATAPEGVTIVGTGRRNLSYGKNSVSLVLRDEFGETATISVIITRPDESNQNTLLQLLQVVNYKLDFDPNTYEYTVSVPYNVKEVYIYAIGQSPDTTITGDGILVINGSNTTAYVNVSYGDLANTTYTVHIKKSYVSLIPIILLTLGLIGTGGGMAYFILKIKNMGVVAQQNAVAVQAAEERSVKLAEPELSINGSSTVGVGQRIVQPTQVETPAVTQAPEEPIKVVETRPTTTPGMVAPKITPVNNLSEVANAPSPQVKVVRKVVTPVNTQSVQQVEVNANNN